MVASLTAYPFSSVSLPENVIGSPLYTDFCEEVIVSCPSANARGGSMRIKRTEITKKIPII